MGQRGEKGERTEASKVSAQLSSSAHAHGQQHGHAGSTAGVSRPCSPVRQSREYGLLGGQIDIPS